jgi:hypothetical protein
MTGKGRGEALYRNAMSYFGGLVVAGAAIILVFALVLQYTLSEANPYLGIFTFMILPAVLSFGLLLFLLGMRRESVRRRRAGTEALPYPRVDLNDPRQRRNFGFALVGGSILSILMAVAGYHAFFFTESVTFCGKICHTVMEPEYSAYLRSPHARVSCVECHVGSGASWYVKSKLSGVRQVLAVTFHTYETPIPVPISNLRPARETCEHCHWPQKFYGAQLVRNPHFRYDEANTAEQISFALKTGGGSPALGQNAGIHWHMILENTVTYAATDRQLEHIPWIRVKHHDGTVTEYVDTTTKLTADELAKLPRHVMDCMDCHNRPTHIFSPPETAVDRALASGFISPSLPWIKKLAVDTLVRDYPDRAAAHTAIRTSMEGFYKEKYPDVASAKTKLIDNAVNVVLDIYDHNVFPAMKVNWTTYASNIGHRNWPGCFRCHDGRHATKDGKILTRDCGTCHTRPQRGPLAPLGETLPASNESWHPFELQGKHAKILCNRCHAAGFRPPVQCAECHKMDTKPPMMDGGCDNCHQVAGSVQPLNDCKTCHDSLPGLHTKGGHPDASCTDCHKPHTWKVTDRDTCLTCHDDKKQHYADGGACANCHEFTGNPKSASIHERAGDHAAAASLRPAHASQG